MPPPNDDSETATRPGFAGRFGSLRVSNFRRYYTGQSISLMGSFAQMVAQSWLVLQLSDSGAMLGLINGLQFLPILLLGGWGGVLADRYDNRKLMMATSTVSALCAAGLGIVSATGHATVWWVAVFALALGMVGPFERPASQSILYELAGPDEIHNAVALNALLAPVSRLVGPVLAGGLIATVGLSACFFVNAASFLVVIGALLLVRPDKMHERKRIARGTKGQLRAGLQYARRTPAVWHTLVVLYVAGTLAYNFQTTMPAAVKFLYHGGPGKLALAQSASAVGALVAGVAVAGIRKPRVRQMALAGAAFGALLTLFGVAPNYVVFLVLGVPVGTVSTTFTSLVQTVLQRETDPAMLGRVMALFSIGFFGTTPIGSLVTGGLIALGNARLPFFVGGGATFVACAWLLVVSRAGTGTGSVAPTGAQAVA